MNSSASKPPNKLTLNEQLSYSLRRQYVDGFLFRTIPRSRVNESLLDIGGVKDQQRGRFDVTGFGLDVCAVNISRIKHIDLQADGLFLPIRNNSYDWVLCSELLEHVENPRGIIREAYRVLKAGGTLVITIPFLFRLHADPVDVGRYTPWFLKQHLENTGFADIHIEKQGLFWSVAADMLRGWMRFLVLSGRIRTRLGINVLSRLMGYFRRKALAFDEKPEHQDHDFFGRYVGGLGIQAKKPLVP